MNKITKIEDTLITQFEWVIIKDTTSDNRDIFVATLPALHLSCSARDKNQLEEQIKSFLKCYFDFYNTIEKLERDLNRNKWVMNNTVYTFNYPNNESIEEYLRKEYEFDINIIEKNNISFNYN